MRGGGIARRVRKLFGLEKRSIDWSRAVADAIGSQVSGGAAALGEQVAAVETAAAIFERAFCAAIWEPASPRLPSGSQLALAARALILRGECVFLVRVVDGVVELLPASDFSVYGEADPESWEYEVTLTSPSRSVRSYVTADRVLHFRTGATTTEPWRGRSPVVQARISVGLLASLEQRLREISGGPVGTLLPIPADGEAGEVEGLRQDIGGLKGGTALVETTTTGWGEGRSAAPMRDWKPEKLVPEWSADVEQTRAEVERSVLGMLGVPSSLLANTSTGQREALRSFLHLGVLPMAAVFAEECAAKLEVESMLTFPRLGAADVASKARAFGALAGAGVPAGEARELVGL